LFHFILFRLYVMLSKRYKFMHLNDEIIFAKSKNIKIPSGSSKPTTSENTPKNQLEIKIKQEEMIKFEQYSLRPKKDRSLTLWLYLKAKICKSRLNKGEADLIETFIDRKSYIDNTFSVHTFVKFYTEFQYLKRILLNEFQNAALKLVRPEVIVDEGLKLDKLGGYFSELKRSSNLAGVDLKLYEILVEEELLPEIILKDDDKSRLSYQCWTY